MEPERFHLQPRFCVSGLVSTRSHPEPVAPETQPFQGWSVNLFHVRSTFHLFLLLLLLLELFRRSICGWADADAERRSVDRLPLASLFLPTTP